MFINREKELEIIYNLANKPGFRSLLLYGRRRIGKTFLIKKAIEDKRGIYLLSLKRGMRVNVDLFARNIARYDLPHVMATTFIELFENLSSYLDNAILVIDEFQYLFEKNPEILSDFQYIFDEILQNKSIFVVLCGSSMGLVESIGSSQSSPLFGRFSARLKVNRFSFADSRLFHASLPFTEQVKNFTALGGIPMYHRYFDNSLSFIDNVTNTFFNNSHPLYSEADFLLRQELREIAVYSGILNAIANGKTKITEIANRIYIPAKDMSRYMKTLISLGIVEKYRPINDTPNSRSTRYKIIDYYFRFWYRFVEPLQTNLEIYQIDYATKYLLENLPDYLGSAVEDFIGEAFLDEYPRQGRWWFRDNEIDLIVANDGKKKVGFIEVKWTNKKRDKTEIKKLIEKSTLVNGFDDYKKQYIMISVSGFKGNYDKSNCTFLDGFDLSKMFMNKVDSHNL